MQRSALLIVSALIAGILTGSLGTRVLQAQPQGVKRSTLLQRDLSGIDGQEVVMFIAEIAPGAASGRHYHPGTEIAYVLSGTGVMDIDGQGPSDLKEGAHAMNPPKMIHNARNTGSTPLKILVVMVHPKGELGVVRVP